MFRKADKADFRTKAGKCAKEIIDWMLKNHMWMDSFIYIDGKRFGDYDGQHYHYGTLEEPNSWDDVFVEEDKDPRDYFEWVGDKFLCMSFEGPLYEVLNHYNDFIPGYDDKKIEEFDKILEKHGYYYELGNAWNLALHKI